jgi:hypothetical protein
LAASISQVDVTWNAVPGATSYTIRRGTSSVGPYTAIATGVAGTSYPDTTVFGGTTYYYVVSATSAGGEGGISNQATVTTPAPFTYQAEAGTLGGFAAFDTSLPNFNGSGFVNLNLAGDSLQIDNFYADVGGTTRMRLRYCNGTASQVTIIATVNGVAQAIPLDPTGSAIWSTVDIIANLNARSANSIRLESTSDIAISIDQFQVNVIDTLPPIVSSGSFVFATSHAIQLQFDEDLNNPVSTANLVIHPQSSGSDIVPASVQYDAPSRTLTFLLSVILPDGNYTAVLGSGSVSDLTGHALAGDFSLPFFALAGDANHDRKVDISDLHVLALNYGQTGRDFTQGDFNYDNVVDGADLAILATRWQTSLTPPPPALPAGLTAPVRRTAARVASLI